MSLLTSDKTIICCTEGPYHAKLRFSRVEKLIVKITKINKRWYQGVAIKIVFFLRKMLEKWVKCHLGPGNCKVVSLKSLKLTKI